MSLKRKKLLIAAVYLLLCASSFIYSETASVKKQSIETYYELSRLWTVFQQSNDDVSFTAYKDALINVLNELETNNEYAAYAVSELLLNSIFSLDNRISVQGFPIPNQAKIIQLPLVQTAKTFFSVMHEDEVIQRVLAFRVPAGSFSGNTVIDYTVLSKEADTGAADQIPAPADQVSATAGSSAPGDQTPAAAEPSAQSPVPIIDLHGALSEAYSRAESLYLRLQSAKKNQNSDASFQLAKTAYIKMLHDTQLMAVIFSEPRYAVVRDSFLRTAASYIDNQSGKKNYEPLEYDDGGMLFPRMLYTQLYKKLDSGAVQEQSSSVYELHEVLCALDKASSEFGIPVEMCLSQTAVALYSAAVDNPFVITVFPLSDIKLLTAEALYLVHAGPLYISRIHTFLKN